MLGDFGKVDWDLGRGDTDAETVENSTGDQLSVVLAGYLYGCPDEPPEASEENRIAASNFVRDGSSDERAND